MEDVKDYFSTNYEKMTNLGLFITSKKGINKESALDIIHDALLHAYKQSQIATKLNKRINGFWIRRVYINAIKSEFRVYFRLKNLFMSAEAWLIQHIEEGDVTPEKAYVNKESKTKLEVLAFIDGYYGNPRTREKYKQYFEIYFEKIVKNMKWKDIQKEYPKINMDTVNSRVHNDILKIYKFHKQHGLL